MALRVGFVQNGTFQRAYAWSQPRIVNRGTASRGEQAVVPNIATVQTGQVLQNLHLDTVNGATAPLYFSGGRNAINTLAPAQNSQITASDTPLQFLQPPRWTGTTNQGHQVTAIYTRLSGAAANDNFQLWLVVYHAASPPPVTNSPQGGSLVPYSALLVRAWHVHAVAGTVGGGFNNDNGGAAFADPSRVPAAGDAPPVINGDIANTLLGNLANYQTQYSTETNTITVK